MRERAAGGTGSSAFGVGIAAAVLCGLLAGSSLLQPGFYDSHDGLLNVHRLFELEKCLTDGQLPCRWVPDMGAGYGYPLFNFYPPLASHVAVAFRGLGADILDAVKWTMLLALVLGSVSMFGLARSFFGTSGGVLAAVLYTFAPYPAVDVFVRGAGAEVWGLALLPLVFWTGWRTVVAPGGGMRWGLACAFAWSTLLLSHGITALMASFFYALWIGAALVAVPRGERKRALVTAALAHGLALALAAWFVFPSLLELKHVHAETLTNLYPWARFENNFLDFAELFLTTGAWGYGPFRGPNGMSLFIGPAQTVAGAAVIGWLGVRIARRQRLDSPAQASALMTAFAVGAAFMTLSISRPLWNALPPLAFLQFPWRFLAIATLGAAFAGGFIARIASITPGLRGRAHLPEVAVVLLCAGTVAIGWSWFSPKAMHPVRDEVLANAREVARSRHGLFDFLPNKVDLESFIAKPPPPLPPPVSASSPRVSIRNASRRSDRLDFEAEVRGDTAQHLTLNVYDFPGWALTVDGASVPFAASDDRLGRLHVRLAPGKHRVSARFENTPVRSFSNGLSAVAALVSIVWGFAIVRQARARK